MFYAYTRPRYQVSVYRTIGPLVADCQHGFRNQRLAKPNWFNFSMITSVWEERANLSAVVYL